MKRTRTIAAGALAALTLGVGAGFAAAQTDPTPTARPPAEMPGMQRGDMGEMHAQMRAYMPDDMQARCDTAHASMNGQMGAMMDRGAMDR